MSLFSPEEMAAEAMARSDRELASGNAITNRRNSSSIMMPELNMDPLPVDDMILQGDSVQEGGTVDQVARRRRHMILAMVVLMATAVTVALGVTIPLVLRNTAERRSSNANAAASAASDMDMDMSGHDMLLDEDELAQEEVEQVMFVDGNNGAATLQQEDADDDDELNADELAALQQARRAGILTKLAQVSDATLLQDSTNNKPQYRAAQWIMEEDALMLNADDEDAVRLVQRYVMALLYYALEGNQWTSSANFLTAASVCEWQGVGCLPYGHTINHINLGNNTLEGSIPSEIGHLRHVGTYCIALL
jgi:hypothetical protein